MAATTSALVVSAIIAGIGMYENQQLAEDQKKQQEKLIAQEAAAAKLQFQATKPTEAKATLGFKDTAARTSATGSTMDFLVPVNNALNVSPNAIKQTSSGLGFSV